MKITFLNRCKNPLLLCVAIAFAITLVGCETVMIDSNGNKRKKKEASWFTFKKKEYQTPQSVTVTWSHDILTLPGRAPTRGFGGRFYFYNEKTQAIPVDGDLMVYGFDDTHKQKLSEDLNQATKRFRFTAEQLTTHFTEGELGASYSVWIPWDEAYGPAKKIMLIPTFVAKDGKLIRGAAASLNLPGSGDDPSEGVIQQTSAIIPTATPDQMIDMRRHTTSLPESGLRTTTIQVPMSSLLHGTSASPASYPVANSSDYQVNPTQSMSQPVSNNIQANYAQGLNDASNTVAAEYQQANGQPGNLAVASFSPPRTMSVPKMTTKNVNGWVMPEYSPMDVSALVPRSVPNQLPAQAAPNAPSSPYLIR